MEILRRIDFKLLNGGVTKLLRRLSLMRQLNDKSYLRMDAVFSRRIAGEFDQLSERFGSDKGGISNYSRFSWPNHTYSHIYSMFFSHNREQIRNLLEVGIGTNSPTLKSSMGLNGIPGASLYLWREWFPNSMIVGLDIDENILFSDERIETFYVDQTNASTVTAVLEKFPLNHFDVIIDDGLHTFEANILFFEVAINRMSNSGVYFIEDVRVQDIEKFKDYFAARDFEYYIFSIHRLNETSTDNNVIVIKQATPE
jgi:hypothetical protein